MNRLPQVFVFHVSADVVVKEKIDHLDVAVGSSNVQLEKTIPLNPITIKKENCLQELHHEHHRTSQGLRPYRRLFAVRAAFAAQWKHGFHQ
jgi:hypothetical protein